MPCSILAGITVLDMSEYIAGPYSATLLADLGARVIKLEPPDGAEERRLSARERYRGNTRVLLAYNRGKECLALDLGRPEGRDILYQIIPTVDVVVQNFAPGVAHKLGIDYETLSARNPALIFLSSTAFGEVGPYRKRKGFDMIAHAASGIMSNYADDEGVPRGPGAINYADISTALFNALALVSALLHRQRTGEGQKIETSLFSTGLALQAQTVVHVDELDRAQHQTERRLLANARADGKTHTQMIDEIAELRLRADLPDTTRPIEVPDCRHRPTDRKVYPYYRIYPTGDGYLAVAALNRGLREKLCAALEVSDPHIELNTGEVSDEAYAAHKTLMARIEERLGRHPNAYWIQRLEAAGVPCGPVNYRSDLYDDPQVQALGMMWELASQLGPYKVPGNPIRFSKTPVSPPDRGGPALGQDSDTLLAEWGYGRDDIARLRAAGIVK
jgi:crotonobetainyl-CoA:carnitine CoA-transferase CaiB-like acyl-CoA transferase